MKKPKVKAQIVSCRLTPDNKHLKGVLHKVAKSRGIAVNELLNNLLANVLKEYTSNDPF